MSQTIRQQLDDTIRGKELLEHPFYRAWNRGELSRATLADYAADYGTWIRAVSRGWERCGENDHAREEEHHAALWGDFAGALGTEIPDRPRHRQVRDLVDVSEHLFARRSTALGALYAFEAQQPATSVTKLEGLRTHYPVDRAAERYFETHAGDYGEAEFLSTAVEALSPEGREEALAACETMAGALWNALSAFEDHAVGHRD